MLDKVKAPTISNDFAVMFFKFSLHYLRRVTQSLVSFVSVRLCQSGIALPVMGFITLLLCFRVIATYFNVTIRFSTAVSFALLLAPYWAFGFGFDKWLRRNLQSNVALSVAPLSLTLAYLVFALPQGQFRWSMFLGITAIVSLITLLLRSASQPLPGWRDWVVLAVLGVAVDLHFFDQAWPITGLSGMPKLLFVDAGLYGYLVLRPLPGIGFAFNLRRSDAAIGLREFLYYTPIALVVGFALGFLHFHRISGSLPGFGAAWLFTLFFVAMPEELFFRGLMLNLLEKRVGRGCALGITSLLFGLAHFNKRTMYFNWRYVILAAIAGVFYGRAWLVQRRLLASSITHATVDTVWSIWLR
jgi:membrane protease YdiL (CAAX protease family)